MYYQRIIPWADDVEPSEKEKEKSNEKEQQQHKEIGIIHNTTAMNPKYYCEVCDYFARDAYNMRKHVDTRKHLQMCSVAGTSSAETVKTPNPNTDGGYKCEFCEATYKYRQSLWRHKQKLHCC